MKCQIGPHGTVNCSSGEGLAAKGPADDITLLLGKGNHLNGMPVLIPQLPKALHTFDTGQYAVGSVIDPTPGHCVDVGPHADSLPFAGQRTNQIAYGIDGRLKSRLLHTPLHIGPSFVIGRRIGQSCGSFPWHKADLSQPGEMAG